MCIITSSTFLTIRSEVGITLEDTTIISIYVLDTTTNTFWFQILSFFTMLLMLKHDA